MLSGSAIKRLIEPEEIAALVGFLAVMTYDVHQMLELARAGHATAGTMPAGR